MPGVRDHEPVVIEDFNGWYDRGDPESCPLDHFNQADNVQYFNSGVETRDVINIYQELETPLKKIKRIYDYVTSDGPTLLVLVDGGKIYHVIDKDEVFGPILTIPAMDDFGFVSIAGRAYITPFSSRVNTLGQNVELGLDGEFLYVYDGENPGVGKTARKAAGIRPTNGSKKPFLAYNSPTAGKIVAGIHVLAVAFNGGPLGLYTAVNAPGEKQIQLTNIPIGPGGTTSRTIVMAPVVEFDKYKPADNPTRTYYVAKTIADNTTTNAIIDFDEHPDPPPSPYVPGGGTAPTAGTELLVEQDTADGYCDFGFHLIGVVYETDTGYLTAPGPEFFGGADFLDTTKGVKVSNIPVSPNPSVKKRHLVSTKWIPEYNGDQKGYQFFFIPGGEIDNNTDTTKVVSYYDADLLEDASHLIDNLDEIPSGVALTTYHSRLVLVGDGSYPKKEDGTPDTSQPDNRSVAYVSAPGEPEAISGVDGLLITPLDGNPLTNCQEFRDILYLFKKTRTYGYADNEDEPATWKPEKIDEGIGAPVHGIAQVLDTGGINIDYLLIADMSGFMLFNGTYARPELSWKIEDFWQSIDKNGFRHIQVMNDSINKKIWMTLPDPNRHHMLHLDYTQGLDPKNVKWARWIFDVKVSTIAIIETTKLIVGALENAETEA